MEDIPIWLQNSSKNLELMLKNVNLIKITINNVEIPASPVVKYGEFLIMDMSVRGIMEVPMKTL